MNNMFGKRKQTFTFAEAVTRNKSSWKYFPFFDKKGIWENIIFSNFMKMIYNFISFWKGQMKMKCCFLYAKKIEDSNSHPTFFQGFFSTICEFLKGNAFFVSGA